MIRRTSGFTIIEVTLFLAVSGVLTVGLLAAASVSIQRQQYRDAVQSFAGYLRDEYARVISVENDRGMGGDDETCPVPGVSSSDSLVRGQSRCVIVGRYINAANNGTEYVSYPIYANPTTTVTGATDWNYAYDEDKGSTYGVSWGAKTRLAATAVDRPLSIVMYRNPDTGHIAIQNDSANYAGNKVHELIEKTDSNSMQSREICVYDTGWFSSERQSIFLAERAGSGDAITVVNATEGCND